MTLGWQIFVLVLVIHDNISYTQSMFQPQLNQIRRRLLSWYGKNRRDLPWRRTRNPYAIWIAETMLQQTQVKSVLPYYRRFLRAFPTTRKLDRASKEEVLALWSGLGYYRRAENLKKAARIIMREHRGKLPRKFDLILALPGVGPYTAAAVMSIAFNQAYPALDTNARRVLRRAFNSQKEKELWEAGHRLVAHPQPGQLNQALMELGATICAAQEPNCPLCPISRSCAALKSGRVRSNRLPATKRRTEIIQWPLVVIENRKRILLRRRPSGGILGGLWEVPGGQRKKGESLETALTRHLNGLGRTVRPESFVGEIRHAITYRKIRAPVFFSSGNRKSLQPQSTWRWASLSALHRYPLSALSLKAIRLATRR